MKRIIKFRGWDKATGNIKHFDGDTLLANITNPSNKSDFIPMQYSGQKDKNGKEIYEGDICENDNARYVIEYCRAGYDEILAFHPMYNGCTYNHYYGSWSGDDFVVIGNIYENPELMRWDIKSCDK
jgi:uncharacterized phage protein (TIGR01671 family)